MPEKAGTGGAGLFEEFARTAPKEEPKPTEPQALQALEARGTALLLGMLSRLQAVEGILRLERIGRLSAEETIRTTVIDNEEATLKIAELEEAAFDLIAAQNVAEARLAEQIQLATNHIDAMTSITFNQIPGFELVQTLLTQFSLATGIPIAEFLPR